MRIGLNLHAADPNISGVEYYALGLIRALTSIDHRNQYVLLTNRPSVVQTHVPSADNLQVIHVPRCQTRAGRILWEQTQLPSLAERLALDVLHCPSYICPLRRLSVPYVVTIHDTIALDHPEWCTRANAMHFGLLMGAAVRTAACVICVSSCAAEDLARRFPAMERKIRVIHPGLDDVFTPSVDRERCERVQRRYGLSQAYVLYVGNIEPKKNVMTLWLAQKRLRQRGLRHQLVIVGKRSWRSRPLLRLLRREAGESSVVLTGYVDRADLPCLYQMADAFVFPSLYEGFGFPPLEAMACGTPVVASNRGALAETLAQAALIVDPYDIDGIAEAVVALTRDSHLRDSCIRNGLKRRQDFDWSVAARETLAVYEEVATNHTRMTPEPAQRLSQRIEHVLARCGSDLVLTRSAAAYYRHGGCRDWMLRWGGCCG
jgi:glycosyltransferase involved in cell wall biosynthesis